jgi:hypothetical protein
LARSLPIRIPPMFPSDWYNEQFLAIGWQEDLRGKTFMQLMRGSTGGFNNPIYDHIFNITKTADSQRVAGSIFGSMHHVAGSVPPGSAQMLGASEQMLGGSERLVGGSERMLGGSERMLGGSERMLGGSERMLGGSESLSSYALVAGGLAGIGASGSSFSLPSMSGVGMSMSGVGMSMSGVGMNMSGVGFSIPAGPAVPPELSRPTLSGVGMSGIGMSGAGFFASMPPIRARKFWLLADAELIVYGATEPDATVFIGGQPVPLNSDGTFRFHMSFRDGQVDFPILAIAADGVQTRSVHMNFNRATLEQRTNSRDEAIEESY